MKRTIQKGPDANSIKNLVRPKRNSGGQSVVCGCKASVSGLFRERVIYMSHCQYVQHQDRNVVSTDTCRLNNN